LDANKSHTEVRACLLDLLNFIAEQIERARNDHTEQHIAIDAARGVIPFIQSRLKEDDFLQTIFMLTFDQQVTAPQWRHWWETLSKLSPQEFSKEADTLLNPEKGPLATLRRQLIPEPL